MNGWGVALLVGLVCGIYMTWQSEAIDRERQRADRAETLLEGIEQQREINRKYDEIDKGLQDGGEDDLSDYMSGAASKLWP